MAELLTDFIQNNFVADGMCADVAVHDPYPPGHNPHAHIMVTVRPLDEKGNWQYKTEKEYLCVRNGEERGFTAADSKRSRLMGWEKQYPYKVGRKKVYLPPPEAEKHGYERVSKYPKSTEIRKAKSYLRAFGTAKNSLSSGARRGQMQRIVIWSGTAIKNALTTAAIQNGDWTNSNHS